ncbi:MAG: ATP-binding protein [Roseobacter sp.]
MSSSTALTPSRLTLFAIGAKKRFLVVICTAGFLAALGVFAPSNILQTALFAAAASLLTICAGLAVMVALHRRAKANALTVLTEFLAHDAAPSFVVGEDGQILSNNQAAGKKFGADVQSTLAATLDKTLANPAGYIFRLHARAKNEGSAAEDVVTRRGHIRLTVHKANGDAFLWRIEDVTIAPTQHEGPVLPMILLGLTDVILYMNDPARQLIGDQPKSLDRIFKTLPLKAGEISEVTTASGGKRMLVAEVEAGEGKRALYLLPGSQTAISQQGWNVFQNLPVPLLRVSPDGDVQAFNTMATNLIGSDLEANAHLSDLMEGLGRSITDWLQDTLAGRASQTSEFLRLKRTDKEVFVQVTLNKVFEAGEPALIAVLSDATELKSLEAQFVQSQKMQAIGQLAGGVAHDFNNLLTAISGHCDLLLLRHDQGDPDFSDLVQINQNANRAAALVGQLLAFSRKQTLRPETLDMRDTLSDLTHLLNRLVGEKVTLSLTHDPVLQPIRADKRQLEQVLMNLVVNARDAMPNGGEIRIDTQCTHLKEALKRDRVSVPSGDYVTLKVTDEGVGIPSDKLQKVFEPFFTTKRTGEGTGLGLSTAYGIVKQTGGYIFVDSTVGSGTCFTLYFPVLDVQESAVVRTKTETTKPTGKHGDGVILLVEDEAPVRAFASRALRLRGYTVLEADSAEAALRTLEDTSLNVDVFVTDVVMPGMDGPSWVREALKERPEVRVVFVSGYAEDSFGEAQMKIPNSVFLPKPFSLNDLTDTVHKQLH